MTGEDKVPKTDDVPEGFTLVTPEATAPPGAAASPGDVPAGFTNVTPQNPAGGGVLLNPGGDQSFTKQGTQGTVPTPPEEKSVTGFLGNVLTSTGHLLNNVVKSIIPYDATNFNDAIPLKRATDTLFDLAYGTGRLAARKLGRENLPVDPEGLKGDQAVQAFRDYVDSRYGSFDKFKDSWYHDPAGMAADLSTVLTGGETVAEALPGMGKVAAGLGKAAEITNPLYVPSKIASGTRGLISKATARPAELPPFDPKTGTFVPEFDPFDPATGGYKSPPPKQPETMQDAVERLRSQWGVKPPKSGLETPEPPAAAPPPKPAAPTPAPARPAGWKDVAGPLASSGVTGAALELLAHHFLGTWGAGILTTGAIKLLPKLLKSEAGQQMLARLGPGSDAARVAGVARDLVPALNTLYQSQLQQQSMGQRSALDRAKGGMVNPELARLQREGLQLPGIHDMLERKY
jgi:hypothetical protein